MTEIIRAIPDQPIRWPYSLPQLAADVQRELGGYIDPLAPLSFFRAAPFYVLQVSPTTPPAITDPRLQRVEPAAPELVDGSYQQAWAVRDATAEEIAAFDQLNAPQREWIQFGLALASLPAVDALLATVEAASRPLERMLSGGLLQAAQGDPRTFLAAWAKVVEHGLISPELIQLVAGLAEQYSLPPGFVAGLTPSP